MPKNTEKSWISCQNAVFRDVGLTRLTRLTSRAKAKRAGRH